MSILERVLRAGEGRMVRRLKAIADAVNSIEDQYTDLTDDELRDLTEQYRERLAEGESLDDLLPERSPRSARPRNACSASGLMTSS